MELTVINRVHVVEPQDEVMDLFRMHFPLVASCNVSEDGKLMIYQMQTLASAARWLSTAKQIITANGMSLECGVKAYKKKGQAIPHRVELRIVYTPK